MTPSLRSEYSVLGTQYDSGGAADGVRHNGSMFGTPLTDRGHLFAAP